MAGNLMRSLKKKLDSIFIPISMKLMLGFVVVIVLISVLFIVVGMRLISDRFISEAQVKVRNDLNTAREIYLNQLERVSLVTSLTADRFFLREALSNGTMSNVEEELTRIKDEEGLDFLTITDEYANVLLRTSNPDILGDSQGSDEVITEVLLTRKPHAATIIESGEDLKKESPPLAKRAELDFVETPLARKRPETEQTAGMVLKSAAPIFDENNKLVGIIYGGVLLNRDFSIVDKIKQTAYQGFKYEGKDIGTSTIFQDDVRISTNVLNENGTRALGTRISEEVYEQVVDEGEPWIGRAYVVNDWYITAYEPIKDIFGRIIGILYVGMLEKRYVDIREQTTLSFLGVTLAGIIVSLFVAYWISKRISIPIIRLSAASKELAQGNLDAQVLISTNDELGTLSGSFNEMIKALKRRDERLRDFATQKIMESERLALIGQLAANIAHELNNPLQGIVAYSHLLLEDTEFTDPTRKSLEKIVGQANRCRDIIRGLLDFSRQRKPEKILVSVNKLLEECVSLVENQSVFQNITIVEDFPPDLPMVVIDPSQVERVFLNIIINAAEAMDGDGRLGLTTRYNHKNESIEITFTDTGCGIAPENLDHIFDPFFTTKDVGHGTGLGLAISYGIIKAHKGAISVESEVGKGTMFKISLPLKEAIEAGENGRKEPIVVY